MQQQSKFTVLQRVNAAAQYNQLGNALIREESSSGIRIYNCIGSIDIDGRMFWWLDISVHTVDEQDNLKGCIYHERYGHRAMTVKGCWKQLKSSFPPDMIPEAVLKIVFTDMIEDASKYLDDGVTLDDARKMGMNI